MGPARTDETAQYVAVEESNREQQCIVRRVSDCRRAWCDVSCYVLRGGVCMTVGWRMYDDQIKRSC